MKKGTTMANKEPKRLPGFLKPYFWETDFSQVQERRHRTCVIERVLEYGDDRAIRWLRESYTPAQVARVVKTSRAISPNTANLWSLTLGIPRDKIRCFSEPSLSRRDACSRG
jgi:hypothetical protein